MLFISHRIRCVGNLDLLIGYMNDVELIPCQCFSLIFLMKQYGFWINARTFTQNCEFYLIKLQNFRGALVDTSIES